jgi:hypothetical protein
LDLNVTAESFVKDGALRCAVSLCVALLSLTAAPARAGTVKCKSNDGAVTYTENTCPAGTRSVDLVDTTSSSASSRSSAVSPPPSLSPRAHQPTLVCNSGVYSQSCEEAACARYDGPLAKQNAQLGTDGEVRACSRARNLPSTSSWAQISSSGTTASEFKASFVCLPKGELRVDSTSLGEKRHLLQVRHTVNPEAPPPAGFYSTAFPDQLFMTTAAVADFGCHKLATSIPARQ